MKARLLVLAAAAAVFLGGCATIVDGKTQAVTIESNPTGADVFIGGSLRGKTPLTIKLRRKKGQIMVVKKDGYKDRTFPMITTVNRAFYGNIITGGVFGSTTDASTGAMYKYEPGKFLITMDKK